MKERRHMVKKGIKLSVRCQSSLLGLNRSGLYYKQAQEQDTMHTNLIGEVYMHRQVDEEGEI